jgi:hypothetical protein
MHQVVLPPAGTFLPRLRLDPITMPIHRPGRHLAEDQ